MLGSLPILQTRVFEHIDICGIFLKVILRSSSKVFRCLKIPQVRLWSVIVSKVSLLKSSLEQDVVFNLIAMLSLELFRLPSKLHIFRLSSICVSEIVVEYFCVLFIDKLRGDFAWFLYVLRKKRIRRWRVRIRPNFLNLNAQGGTVKRNCTMRFLYPIVDAFSYELESDGSYSIAWYEGEGNYNLPNVVCRDIVCTWYLKVSLHYKAFAWGFLLLSTMKRFHDCH